MEGASLTLPKDLIEGAISQHVALAVANAFGSHSVIITRVVQQVLAQKVGNDGQPSKYGNDTMTFVQWAMQDALKKAVQDALVDEIKKHEADIRQQIATQLRSTRSPLVRQLVENMASGIVEAASNKYRLTVKVES